MSHLYAGIGSRRTPSDVQHMMARMAKRLAELGFTLRSGGADGADKAFEAGATKKEIFYAQDATPETIAIASKLHPAWHLCNEYARNLHARNVNQILGRDLKSPVDFVLCYTPDGCTHHSTKTRDTGGTGMAISVASTRDIPVINMANKEWKEQLTNVMKRLGYLPTN